MDKEIFGNENLAVTFSLEKKTLSQKEFELIQEFYAWLAAKQTNDGLTLRACVSSDCGWVGKESACLTWKHAGNERMCPYCHDNTESATL